MQVSRNELFIFLEGRTNDRYFYGKLCDCECLQRNISYEDWVGDDLPGASGGKQSLIVFFRYLRRTKKLIGNFHGKVFAVLFFLDKDIDDVLRRRLRSPHISYTEYYDVENHIFKNGSLAEASAAAASLNSALLHSYIPDSATWCAAKAELWKEWVKLCILEQKTKMNCGFNYARSSRINNPTYGPLDANAHAVALNAIKSRLQSTPLVFEQKQLESERVVESSYRRGHFDRVFKGKWYSEFLEYDIRLLAGARTYNSNNLRDRLICSIIATINYSGTWSQHFRQSIRKILDLMEIHR